MSNYDPVTSSNKVVADMSTITPGAMRRYEGLERSYNSIRESRNQNVAGLANPSNATPGGMEPSSNTFTRTSPNVQRYRAEAQSTESALDRENRTNPYSVMNQARNMEQQRKQREMAAQQRRNPPTPLYGGPQNANQNPLYDPFGTQQPQPKYTDRITGNSDRAWDKMEGKYTGEYETPQAFVAPQPQNRWGNQATMEQQQAADQARYEEEMRKRQAAYQYGAPNRAINRFENSYMRPFEAGFMPGFSSNYQN